MINNTSTRAGKLFESNYNEKHFDNFIKLLYHTVLFFYSKNKKNTGRVQPINFFNHTNLHKDLRKFYDKQPVRVKKKAKANKVLFLKMLGEY